MVSVFCGIIVVEKVPFQATIQGFLANMYEVYIKIVLILLFTIFVTMSRPLIVQEWITLTSNEPCNEITYPIDYETLILTKL